MDELNEDPGINPGEINYKDNIKEISAAILKTNHDISDDDLYNTTEWIMKARINGALAQLVMTGRASIGWRDGSPVFVYVHQSPGLN
jgi:hypothetical protein